MIEAIFAKFVSPRTRSITNRVDAHFMTVISGPGGKNFSIERKTIHLVLIVGLLLFLPVSRSCYIWTNDVFGFG